MALKQITLGCAPRVNTSVTLLANSAKCFLRMCLC